ncbi:hypothetical protein [Vibrio parahaemolyticus]|uniref:hypothetical protein n=1 Tax=Vibrio parahaemolyticus TaxID=670 RepID=UPI001E3B800B|nr:hypothetical protein [Vibrio parahaemolyticus]
MSSKFGSCLVGTWANRWSSTLSFSSFKSKVLQPSQCFLFFGVGRAGQSSSLFSVAIPLGEFVGTKAYLLAEKAFSLVFYFSDDSEWSRCCDQMLSAGFMLVLSYNAYWDVAGKTFEDVDGYRVVLQNREWNT